MMSTTQGVSLSLDDLEQRVQAVEPAAFLVPPRLLRRVIKQHRALGGIGLLVPHRKGYVIDRAALLRSVSPGELGLVQGAVLPAYFFLLVRPEADQLASYTVGQSLVKHWRILFHLHIDHAMQQKLVEGTLTRAMVRERVRQLGLTEFAEITTVLAQDAYLLPPETIETIYAEFVAVYLTLRHFDPARVSHFFPVLRDLAAVDALVATDIDAQAIYHATRLLGAPAPTGLLPRITQTDGLLGSSPDIVPLKETVVEDKALLARAAELDARGNTVRAAILRTRAFEGVRQASTATTGTAATLELDGFRDRLQKALELTDGQAENWRQALLPLLVQAARGYWSQEARLLYDLQSVCVDSEHGIYAVDLVEWAMSLGKLPIKRRMPGHQAVTIVRHLRRAIDRMRNVRMTDTDRQRLTELLTSALEHRERLMRERFRPLIAAALDEVGLKPNNVPETMARAKMIEELLDRLVAFGHLNIGNLRDAISRNQLKLPDLKNPAELVLGDPLIRLNRKLAIDLDGVYRRGEFYMRLLHRLSSVGFGTGFGRLLVLFLILPFGLAFFAMITPGIVMEEGEKVLQLIGLMEKPPAPPGPLIVEPIEEEEWDEWETDEPETPKPSEPPGRAGRHEFPVPNLWGVAGLGVFFLLLIHVGWFRRRFFSTLGNTGRGLHTGSVWLVHRPPVQAILHNRFWTPFRRFVFWPVLMATASGLIAGWCGLEMPSIAAIVGGCLTLGMVLLNTELGRDVEETASDWLVRFWIWASIDFVPGLLRLIVDLSRWCLEAVEQILYTVNEALHSRRGENRASVAAKAGFGLVWFWLTYFIRFAINLLIEPQVNPIKHFPVVTVSHKVCLPMIPTLAGILRNTGAVSRPTTTATGIIFGIPGIFGFMVWELKENWKLYSSNRAPNLKPVLIGSHGENMLRLLRPGFHSGTIPTLFKKLRRAERHGQRRTVRKIKASLHHVRASVEHFVERELLALLRQSKGWGGLAIDLGPILLATNRVLVALRCPALGAEAFVFAFDHQHGWLLAGVLESGWLPRLNAEQRHTLASALAGLYAMAGVHLVREQILENLPATTVAFEITTSDLVVWTSCDGDHDACYALNAGPEVRPMPASGALPAGMPVLDTERLLFSNTPLTWDDWVEIWEKDRTSSARRPLPMVLLPPAKG